MPVFDTTGGLRGNFDKCLDQPSQVVAGGGGRFKDFLMGDGSAFLKAGGSVRDTRNAGAFQAHFVSNLNFPSGRHADDIRSTFCERLNLGLRFIIWADNGGIASGEQGHS